MTMTTAEQPRAPEQGAPLTNYRCVVAYDGRPFFGWQRLKDKPTVQGTLEAAIEAAFGERAAVIGAGRTDRGAHALGQVAGFRLSVELDPGELAERLDEALPSTVGVVEAEQVPPSFHVRTDALAKDYEYRIFNHAELPPELDRRVWHIADALDVEAMRASVAPLLGTHDFASFATKPRFKQRSTTCTLTGVEVEAAGDLVILRFRADRFLMHMVRNMVRAIVKVGEERYQPAKIGEILAAKSRAASPGSAPASGLYLVKVRYAEAPS